jgi:hypothetical protein
MYKQKEERQMRRHKMLAAVIVIMIVLSVLPVQAVSAQATFTDCEAELTVLGFEEGEITFVGPNMHIRERNVVFEQVSDNPLCAGMISVVANYTVDANGDGPKWGTFYWEAPLGRPYTGGFEGTFTGWAEEYTLISSVYAVGQGYGDLEGLKIHEYIDFDFSSSPPQGIATLTILNPHGK